MDMQLIQSLKNEFCFDLPLFSKYPATSVNSYFYKMTLHVVHKIRKVTKHSNVFENGKKIVDMSEILN